MSFSYWQAQTTLLATSSNGMGKHELLNEDIIARMIFSNPCAPAPAAAQRFLQQNPEDFFQETPRRGFFL
jgi:hypothetical protein